MDGGLQLVDAINMIRADVILRRRPRNPLKETDPLFGDLDVICQLVLASHKRGLSIEKPIELIVRQAFRAYQNLEKMRLFVYSTLFKYSMVFTMLFCTRIALFWIIYKDLNACLRGYGVVLALSSFGASFFLLR